MTFALRACAPDIFVGAASWVADHRQAAQKHSVVLLAASILLIARVNAGGHTHAHSCIPMTFGSPAMSGLQVAVRSQRNVDFPELDVWLNSSGRNLHIRYSLAG